MDIASDHSEISEMSKKRIALSLLLCVIGFAAYLFLLRQSARFTSPALFVFLAWAAILSGPISSGLLLKREREVAVLAAIFSALSFFGNGLTLSSASTAIGGFVFIFLGVCGVMRVANLLRQRKSTRRSSDTYFSFDLDSDEDVARLDEIRDAYSRTLERTQGEYRTLMYRPTTDLPYSKIEILAALDALLDYSSSRRSSRLLDASIRTSEYQKVLEACKAQLQFFVDNGGQPLPTDMAQNVLVGSRLAGHK
jgi:hypothetical protein